MYTMNTYPKFIISRQNSPEMRWKFTLHFLYSTHSIFCQMFYFNKNNTWYLQMIHYVLKALLNTWHGQLTDPHNNPEGGIMILLY